MWRQHGLDRDNLVREAEHRRDRHQLTMEKGAHGRPFAVAGCHKLSAAINDAIRGAACPLRGRPANSGGLLWIPLPRPTEHFGRARGYRERARAVAPTAQTVVWTLRSFPKEFNHPPSLLGQGSTLINDVGSCRARLFSVSARSPRFWASWASAAQKVPY